MIFKYEMPRHVNLNTFDYDKILLNSLAIIKNKQKKMYRTILRATEAMMNGFSNSDDVSNESRILEQSRAFEILFNLPERNQRREFKEKIEMYFRENNERKRSYKSERPRQNVPEVGTRQVMWADRFYTLRNHIIHGEKLKDSDFLFFGQRHIVLGLWFFIVSLKKIINVFLNETKFYDTIKCESGNFIYDKQPFKAITLDLIKNYKLFE